MSRRAKQLINMELLSPYTHLLQQSQLFSSFTAMAQRAPLIVPAAKKHTASVIWAHGLGDSGAGWMPIAENYRLRGKFEEVKFIFPNAPSMPITVNFGMQLPAWHDIKSFESLTDTAHDEPGILKSAEYFHSLIKAEIDKGIPSNRIVLGGFSQGGAISLYAGTTSPYKLAGIFGLSSYLLLHTTLSPRITVNRDTPIFMGHGDEDPLVKYKWGQETAKALEGMGCPVDFRTYDGLAHSADPREMDDLEAWLRGKLPPTGE